MTPCESSFVSQPSFWRSEAFLAQLRAILESCGKNLDDFLPLLNLQNSCTSVELLQQLKSEQFAKIRDVLQNAGNFLLEVLLDRVPGFTDPAKVGDKEVPISGVRRLVLYSQHKPDIGDLFKISKASVGALVIALGKPDRTAYSVMTGLLAFGCSLGEPVSELLDLCAELCKGDPNKNYAILNEIKNNDDLAYVSIFLKDDQHLVNTDDAKPYNLLDMKFGETALFMACNDRGVSDALRRHARDLVLPIYTNRSVWSFYFPLPDPTSLLLSHRRWAWYPGLLASTFSATNVSKCVPSRTSSRKSSLCPTS
jgi:hypothetical protein